jgi:predicted O-methyltransferase YrrM
VKVKSILRRLIAASPLVSAKQDYPLCDVTATFAEFDLSSMAVITTAPVWMTRAERLLLYTLTFTLRPTRYLEIGTLRGGSALIVAAALDHLNSDGRLICVDPAPQIEPDHWQQLAPRTTLLTGYSPDVLREARRLAGGPFDMVLIDGDHSYQGAIRDAAGVLEFVADGAYLLFHDCFFPEVGQAIDDFVAEHPNHLLDHGPLTREITTEARDNGPALTWGGLRMLQVRH